MDPAASVKTPTEDVPDVVPNGDGNGEHKANSLNESSPATRQVDERKKTSIKEKVYNIAAVFRNGLSDAVNFIWDKLRKLWDYIFLTLKKLWDYIFLTLKTLWDYIWNNLNQLWDMLTNPTWTRIVLWVGLVLLIGCVLLARPELMNVRGPLPYSGMVSRLLFGGRFGSVYEPITTTTVPPTGPPEFLEKKWNKYKQETTSSTPPTVPPESFEENSNKYEQEKTSSTPPTGPPEFFEENSNKYEQQWDNIKKKWDDIKKQGEDISKRVEHHDVTVSVVKVTHLLEDFTRFAKDLNALFNKQTESFNQEPKSSAFDENTKKSYKEVYKVLVEQAREIALPIYKDLLSKRCDVAFKKFENKSTSWAPLSTSKRGEKTKDFAIAVRQYKRDVLKDFEEYLIAARIEIIDYEREELKIREKILRQIDDKVFSVGGEKINIDDLITSAESIISIKLETLTSIIITTAYESATDDSHDPWTEIRRKLKDVVESEWSHILTEYGLDEATQTSKESKLILERYGRKIVTDQAKSKASRAQVIQQMTERFDKIFKPAKESTEQRNLIQTVEKVEALAKQGRSEALKVLSVLAVVRLDDKADDIDVVEQTLESLLLGQGERTSRTQLTATSWAGIPPKQILLNPKKCFDIWKIFYSDSQDKVEAILARRQNTSKLNSGEGKSDEYKDTPDLKTPDLKASAKERWDEFKRSHKEWVEISNDAKGSTLIGFGSKVNALLTEQIASFVEQSSYKDDKTRASYRVILEMEAGEIVLPIYQRTLEQHYETTITMFKSALTSSETSKVMSPVELRQLKRKALGTFDKRLTDTQVDYIDNEKEDVKYREKLLHQIDAEVSSMRDGKTRDVISFQKVEMQNVLVEFTRTTLQSGTDKDDFGVFTWTSLKSATDKTWSKVQDRLKEEVESAKSSLDSRLGFRLSEYALEETRQNSVFEELGTYGREIVIKEAKRQASDVVQYMTERFETIFGSFSQDVLIQTIAEREIEARFSALKVLSVLAVIRLNEETSYAYGRASDPVDKILVALLFRGRELTARSWQGVPPEQTLLSPLQCSKIWIEFLSQTDHIVEEALANLQEGLPQKDKLSYPNSNGAQTNDILASTVVHRKLHPEKEESQDESTHDLVHSSSTQKGNGITRRMVPRTFYKDKVVREEITEMVEEELPEGNN